MKYYKDHVNNVYAYESNGSQDHLIPSSQTMITESEADALRYPALSLSQRRESMRCSAWQLRRALTQEGLRAAVESAIAAADQDTKDMWEYATEYQRMHPIVLALATTLNKTGSEIDALFDLALTIVE